MNKKTEIDVIVIMILAVVGLVLIILLITNSNLIGSFLLGNMSKVIDSSSI